LTFALRAAHVVEDRDGGMVSLQSNNGNWETIEAQAGMAMAGSNGLPVFSTPKQITSSLRIAAQFGAGEVTDLGRVELTVATRARTARWRGPAGVLSAAPVFFERRLAGSTSSFDALLKRPQMRYGGSFGSPRADDPDGAVRIIDCLNPIDPMSRDNPIPVHPAI
jgi:hypothetical protein